LGAFQNGELVAYLWLCHEAYEEDEVRCRFVPLPKDRAAWDFDVYVFPQHRKGIAFACLWDGANSYLSGRDVDVTISRVSAYNTMSKKSHQSLGARKVGTAVFFTAGPLQITVSSRLPYLHVSVKSSFRPRIRVSASSLDLSE
jgi:hypothetical protein